MTIAVLTWAIDKVRAGERVAIASVIEAQGSVPGKPGARLAMSSSGSWFGTIGGAGLELKIQKKLEKMLSSDANMKRKIGGSVEVFLLNKDGKEKESVPLDSLCGGRVTVSMEVINPVPHILIAGGGHVGMAIANVCDNLEWSYSVFDIRKEFSSEKRFPRALGTTYSSVEDFINSETKESIQRFSDILLLSHDWKVDEDLLIGLLRISGSRVYPRIGAIGSNKKWSAFKKSAISSGITEAKVKSVRCPIGLDIGADSPQEIAIAVCAEILALERRVGKTEE